MSMGPIFEHWPNCKIYFSFCHFHRETCWRQSVIANLFLAFSVCVCLFMFGSGDGGSNGVFLELFPEFLSFRPFTYYKVDLLQVLDSHFFSSPLALDMLPSILTWRSERYLSMPFQIQINATKLPPLQHSSSSGTHTHTNKTYSIQSIALMFFTVF